MAAPTQTRRKAAPAPDKKQAQRAAARPEVRKSPGPDAARVPAYAQAKLTVSHPEDAAEKEADKVARQVRDAAQAMPVNLEPGIHRAPQDKVATVPAAKDIQRKAALPEEPKAARRVEQGGDVMAGEPVTDYAQARIQARRGSGSPLPERVKTDMEGRLGQDFSAVRLHTDQEAVKLCTEMQARAFTVGQDIFFASGEFAPETPAGQELLAHELTHVVQQGGGAAALHRTVDPEPPHTQPAAAPDANSQTKLHAVTTLPLPKSKRRHLPIYQAWQQGGRLKRLAGYDREDPGQVSVWNGNVVITAEALNQKLRDRHLPEAQNDNDVVNLKLGGKNYSRTRREWLRDLRVPTWDRQGRPMSFQVDHIVELQVSGEHGEGVGNSIENMELFDADSNTSSGRTMKNAIRARLTEYQQSLPASQRDSSNTAWLRKYSITFENVVIDQGGTPESQSAWWTRSEIANVEPLNEAQATAATSIQGTSREFVLASGPNGIAIGRYRRAPDGATPIPVAIGSPGSKRLAGLTISSINLLDNVGSAVPAGTQIGNLSANWDLPAKFNAATSALNLPIQSTGQLHSGCLAAIPPLTGSFEPLSPFSFESVSVRDGGLYAEGTILPSLPLMANARLVTVLDGNDVSLAAILPCNSLNLDLPGVTLEGGSVSLNYSAANGFGASGSIGFGISGMGTGELGVSATQEHGFGAEGSFNFDPKLFDRASVRVWYRDRQFGGSGEIGIDNPNKVRGIRSANITASFQEGAFSATGTVQPNIPGVQQAGLTVSHSETEGLVIGGSLQLAPNPAIRSGSVDVTLRKQGEDWKVSGTGTAVPAIPGINSQLTVSYDDGAFTAEASGDFRRGLLAGSARVGATNRTLGADGQPSGPAVPGNPIIVYGGGSATLQIAPWLQGTAGLSFAPDGEVSVSGDIGLPSALQIFPRKELNRTLFSVSTQIPIVPGIVAEVGGNLSATAGIGPGSLDQCHIGIEYSPSHEEDTHVTGDAHLNVPADAGLRLAARAGIGLGITGASATGGLELGGGLGIAGAAEAGVHIDWMPSRGLQIDAEGYIHAEPKFRLDVSGYVAVTALGFSVYDHTWRLAEKEIGSNLRLGARFPIHYQDGQPFDVSLSDVEFEVPQVDPAALIGQIAHELF